MKTNKCLEITLHLTPEAFQSFLIGKKLRIKNQEYDLTLYPPHYGLYLTHSQISEIRIAAMTYGAKKVFDLINEFTDNNKGEK